MGFDQAEGRLEATPLPPKEAGAAYRSARGLYCMAGTRSCPPGAKAVSCFRSLAASAIEPKHQAHRAAFDAAEAARKAFASARQQGPEALASLLRQILKSGRRFKPPRLVPVLRDAHGVPKGPRSVCLRTFACPHLPPYLMTLRWAFLSLRPRPLLRRPQGRRDQWIAFGGFSA